LSGFVARRGLALVPTVLGVVTLVFLMVRLIPGDPAAAAGGENLGAEALASLRTKLGISGPLHEQYLAYLGQLLRGNLGGSLHTGLSVGTIVSGALPITMVVGLFGVLVGTALAIPLGALAAYARSRGRLTIDHGLSGLAMAADTMPSFWVALILILFLSLKMRWFPVSGGLDWSNPGALVSRLALPVAVLALGQIASVARVTRTAVLEVLGEDYVRTARAVGTPEREVLFRHALRNALLPVMTVVGLSVGRLLGGTVIVESIFSIPGMGTALVQAIGARDYPIVQGLILVFALLFVLVNLFTDILYTRLDPRVRLS
jgi:ABC-type dipeptide/oligopeptide/nickel transport system permease component